jgi:transglutaminase-like putative cysteine protease
MAVKGGIPAVFHSTMTLFAVVLLLPSIAAAEGNRPLFLGAIEITPIQTAPGSRFEARLYHKDISILASYLRTERSYRVVEEKQYLALTSDRYSFPRKIAAGIKPSFVHDYNLGVFQRLRRDITEKYGASPAEADLIEYVNQYIDKKNYTRGFDVASRIAERKEGDCTEHAVLLVSLLRMFNVPATMVMGIKMFKTDTGHAAFAHAWVEYLHDGTWRAADPTLAMEVDRSYIPVGALENEDVDFAMDLVPVLQKLPVRIEISGF